jgi:hypothetical protein
MEAGWCFQTLCRNAKPKANESKLEKRNTKLKDIDSLIEDHRKTAATMAGSGIRINKSTTGTE